MQVRTYQAASMKEALLRIKEELGDEAAILKSRTVPGPSGRSMVEVTAAVDRDTPSPRHRPQRFAQTRTAQIYQYREQEQGGRRAEESGKWEAASLRTLHSAPCTPLEGRGDRERTLDLGSWILDLPDLPGPFRRMLHSLYRSGVDEGMIRPLIGEIQREVRGNTLGDLERMEALLTESIAGMIKVSGPIQGRRGRPAVVALVGPTGVGKTTTLAKLAANTKLIAEREVALISADTYRIAAVDQLRAFAHIADIPMEVVYEPLEMEQAVAKHHDKALVLIDTAGRSPWNTEQLLELKRTMAYARPDEIHLVVSVTSKPSDLFDAAERFSVVPIDRVLFTKLDETTTFGSMLNVVQQIGKPVSYVTDGQRVPEDIRLARSEELARLVLSGGLSSVRMHFRSPAKGLKRGSRGEWPDGLGQRRGHGIGG